MITTSPPRDIHTESDREARSAELSAELDEIYERFREGDATEALTALCHAMNEWRRAVSADEWDRLCADTCRSHDLHRLLIEDPYTARAFDKPRGYAGDAVMLDYAYRGAPPGVSALGRRLLAATRKTENSESVVWRRDLIAREIDRTARRVPGARVLAVACGHLREAELSEAIRCGGVSEIVALDQDLESVELVRRECAHLPVTIVRGSVRDLIAGRLDLGHFDFIYAAGLYDYLDDRVAEILSGKLLSMLRPAGELLIGNFAPENSGRGYMEAFMDWHLICRTCDDLEGLSRSLTREPGETFSDPWGNVAYVRMTKPSGAVRAAA